MVAGMRHTTAQDRGDTDLDASMRRKKIRIGLLDALEFESPCIPNPK
jgi:hypothetical protein